MLVEDTINNYFKNFVNDFEYYFNNYELTSNLIKNIKQNESFIFHYIYDNFKILKALPVKQFWKIDNSEECYNIYNDHNKKHTSQNQVNEEDENDNEYVFKNLHFGKLDMFLKEDSLDQQWNKMDDTFKDQEVKNVESGDGHTIGSGNGHIIGSSTIESGSNSIKGQKRYIHTYRTRGLYFDICQSENTYNYVKPNIMVVNDKNNIATNKRWIKTAKCKNSNKFLLLSENRNCITFSYILFNFNTYNYSPYNCNSFTSYSNTYVKNEVKSETLVKDCRKSKDLIKNTHIENNMNLDINRNKEDYVLKEDLLKIEKICNSNEFLKTNVKTSMMVDENRVINNINILDNANIISEKNNMTKHRTSEVPVSQISRASVFGKIILNILRNSSIEYIKKKLSLGKYLNTISDNTDILINEKNAEILANGLSKMRGIVLKLGQLISLQEEYLSPILIKALKMVNNSADIMPKSQIKNVLIKELGKNFESKFDFFDYVPFASASIGQVHTAIINKKKVAVKIQYPGVHESIDNDIKNLLFINKHTNLISEKLYIENLCKEIKKELKTECDYINEAKYYIFFQNIFKNSKYFYVPDVYSNYVTKHVLVTSYVDGISLDVVMEKLPQSVKDSIGQRILYLTLHELFVLKIMNTDPNLGNFLYNTETDKLCLIDFGATRSYKNEFVDLYLRLVKAAIEKDKDKIYHYSYMLNFLIGKETEEMINSHIKTVILVGEPFRTSLYNFGTNNIAKNIYDMLSTIIYNRLTPPRSEIYTLHRKLSGSYLICIKLKATVNAAHIFDSIYNNYKFTTEDTYQKHKRELTNG
uniref:ABC1 atypical kinase-like domain-containing protein n=1 Tax=Piliocolobus tephrosceles TaxID=591936 RepID=A0A8C9GKG2_9PRIM